MSTVGKSYLQEQHWKSYQPFFPEPFRYNDQSQVSEEWWKWRGYDVHIDRISKDGFLKVILLHGAGGYGRFLFPLGFAISGMGHAAIAPDLPGYGLTSPRTNSLSYQDWVECVSDLVDFEAKKDSRPIVLFGLSLGGMLAYQVAARNPKVKAIITTTLADTRMPEVMEKMASHPFLGKYGMPLLSVVGGLLDSVRIPIAKFSRMKAMSNNPSLTSLVLKDKLGGNNWVPLRLLRTMVGYQPALEPEEFDTPILLAHPAADTWTPISLSEAFFSRIRGPKKLVRLENCGHAPIEEPGINQLLDAIQNFLAAQNATLTDERVT